MSADNGVYILKCLDKCKIKGAKGIMDSIYTPEGKINPVRTYFEFYEAPEADDMNGATVIAEEIFKEIEYCENGIVIIPIDKPWSYFEQKKRQYIRNRRNAATNTHKKYKRTR